MFILGFGLEGKLNLHPLDVELLINQEDQLLPTLRLLVNLLKLLHIGRKKVEKFKVEFYLL